jgi:hypothetical protein
MKRIQLRCLAVLLAVSFLLISQSGVHAEDLPSSATVETARPSNPPPPTPYGFQQMVFDLKYVVKRPFNLDKQDGLWIGGTFAVAGTLFAYRENIRDRVLDHQSEGMTKLLDDVSIMSKGAFAPALALAAYGTSFLTENDREKETALLLIESAALSQVGAFIGQTVIASERPPDTSVQLFHVGGHGVSGDAALAASVVPPLRRQYLRVTADDSTLTSVLKWAGTAILYGGAALAAYQRVYSDSHWAPDAFLGMMTGLAVGEVLCEAHDKADREREEGLKRPRVTLGAMPGGLIVNVRF